MKTFLRRSLKTLGVLVCLGILFHLVEYWRGKRAWETWKRERIAAGDPLDPMTFVPPGIPDAENFAAVPFIDDAVKGKGWGVDFGSLAPAWEPPIAGNFAFGKTFDLKAAQAALKSGDLATTLAPYNDVLDRLTVAAQLPRSRFKVDYKPGSIEPPPLLFFRAVGRTLRMRALLRLRQGDAEGALKDTVTALRVCKHLAPEPHLITQLLHLAWLRISLQPVWEGIQKHRWNEKQLTELQRELAGQDVLKSWKRSLEFELAGTTSNPNFMFHEFQGDALQGASKLRRWVRASLLEVSIPRGWYYQNLLRINQVMSQMVIPLIDPSRHRVDPMKLKQGLDAVQKIPRGPYTIFGLSSVPLASQNIRVAQTQTCLDQALIACALERYRLAMNRYPESLNELVPMNLPMLPPDVTTGAPLRYERNSEGGYKLWSVGWNLLDEDGKVVEANPEEGDWVWAIPR